MAPRQAVAKTNHGQRVYTLPIENPPLQRPSGGGARAGWLNGNRSWLQHTRDNHPWPERDILINVCTREVFTPDPAEGDAAAQLLT